MKTNNKTTTNTNNQHRQIMNNQTTNKQHKTILNIEQIVETNKQQNIKQYNDKHRTLMKTQTANNTQ